MTDKFEKAQQDAERNLTESDARRELRGVVQRLPDRPKNIVPPKRGKGRAPIGGISPREVAEIRREASKYLAGEEGLRALEARVQHTALVILMIDGVLGTEPWRAHGGGHGGIVAANARLRYLENAARLLDDLRASRKKEVPLLAGVIEEAEFAQQAPPTPPSDGGEK